MAGEVKNANAGKKSAILTVSAGISSGEAPDTLSQAVAEAFPAYEARRAFMGKSSAGLPGECGVRRADPVEDALERAWEDGIKRLVVQPMLLLAGQSYARITEASGRFSEKFEKVAVGRPLLFAENDFRAAAKAVAERACAYDDGRTAICLVGHGSRERASGAYGKMQETLRQMGLEHYYTAVMGARPAPGDLLTVWRERGCYQRVLLMPFMVSAGVHVNRDMAGEGGNSWKSVLEREGYEVVCILEGLGESRAIRKIYMEHIGEAVAAVSDKNFAEYE